MEFGSHYVFNIILNLINNSYTLIIGKPPFETPDVKTTYKKIKMNSYTFPEHVPISDSARNLITKILNLEPTKRPNLDEIL
jgi:polo-like kinase 1